LASSSSSLLHPTFFYYITKMGGHGHARNPEAEPKQIQDVAALKEAKIPLSVRDKCGHLLIDLNKCRRAKMFNPNQCGHERHTYEECEYYLWNDRVDLKTKQVLANKEE
jgi:NADH dehydrogenase (ubiquinone) 1 beta subcomplex subunit 7